MIKLLHAMKEYEIAILIRVKQRGVDLPDAMNRVTDNLALYEGSQFTRTVGDEAGGTTLIRPPQAVMGVKSNTDEGT